MSHEINHYLKTITDFNLLTELYLEVNAMNIPAKILNKLLKISVLTGSLLAIGVTSSQATVLGTYQLFNHPDGNAATPFYGLRLDGLLTGDQNDIYSFDFDHSDSEVFLRYKSDQTIEITGQAFGGEDIGSAYKTGTTAIWELNFTYQNVDRVNGDNDLVSSIGEGFISSTEFGSFDLVTETGDFSFAFRFGDEDNDFGHRDYDGISGWGWMNHAPDTTAVNDAVGVSYLYYSDWLFTANSVSVPEPTTILSLLAVASFGVINKRKNS